MILWLVKSNTKGLNIMNYVYFCFNKILMTLWKIINPAIVGITLYTCINVHNSLSNGCSNITSITCSINEVLIVIYSMSVSSLFLSLKGSAGLFSGTTTSAAGPIHCIENSFAASTADALPVSWSISLLSVPAAASSNATGGAAARFLKESVRR